MTSWKAKLSELSGENLERSSRIYRVVLVVGIYSKKLPCSLSIKGIDLKNSLDFLFPFAFNGWVLEFLKYARRYPDY